MSRRKMALSAVLALTLCLTTGTGVYASKNESTSEKKENVGDSEIRRIADIDFSHFHYNKPTLTPSAEIEKVDPVYPEDSSEPTVKPSDEDIDKPENVTPSIDVVAMYRLYNPNSGEHFYTANLTEKNHLAGIGWRYEGIGWYAPDEDNGIPVYRLYNKNGGEHHYTVSLYERRTLLKLGWRNEGIGWYSYETYNQGNDASRPSKAKRIPKINAVPLYRQYNPNAFSNNHNYTSSIRENNYLVSLGWRAEGIGWYGVNANALDSGENQNNSEVIEVQSRHIQSYSDFEDMEANDKYVKYFGAPDQSDETETVDLDEDEEKAVIYQYDDVSLVDTGLTGTAYLDVIDDYGGHDLKWEYTEADEYTFNEILTSAVNNGCRITQRSTAYGMSEYAQIYTGNSYLSVLYDLNDMTIEIHPEGN